MLTLFHAPMSRSGRILRLLEELGATYQVAYVDIRRMDGSGGPDPANPHPDGKVPALVHDGALVTESAAVALYLADLMPEAGLAPPVGSKDRAAYLTWMAWTVGELEPAVWSKITGETATNPYLAARYEAVVDRLISAVWVGPWLMGQQFTAADVMVAPPCSGRASTCPKAPRSTPTSSASTLARPRSAPWARMRRPPRRTRPDRQAGAPLGAPAAL